MMTRNQGLELATKSRRHRRHTAVWLAYVLLAAACGSDGPKDESPSDGDAGDHSSGAGSGNEAGADASPRGGNDGEAGGSPDPEGMAGSGETDGGAGSGGSSNGGSGNTQQGGRIGEAGAGDIGAGGRLDSGPGEDGPGYDGVDLEGLVLEHSPPDCIGGFDADARTLTVSLNENSSVAFVTVVEGNLQINGVTCESATGEPAAVDALDSIVISGTAEDETLYIDAGAGFGDGVLSTAGGFSVDLAGGSDRLIVLGSDAEDDIRLGSEAQVVEVDFTRNADPDISAARIESVLVSTGPQADVIRADGSNLSVGPTHVPVLLYGGGNNDLLAGGAADDQLFGGIGDDRFEAGSVTGGADAYDGGTGRDWVSYAARQAGVSVTLESGANDGEAGENDDVQASVEDVSGGAGVNSLTGSEAANYLEGGPEDDVIQGGMGDDSLAGNAGNDELRGGEGDDTLFGDDGDDELLGEIGDDTLYGGQGADDINAGAGDGDICVHSVGDTVVGCEL